MKSNNIMKSNNNSQPYSELTANEAATLNGGYYCGYVCVWQWVRNWYGYYYQRVCAVRCYY